MARKNDFHVKHQMSFVVNRNNEIELIDLDEVIPDKVLKEEDSYKEEAANLEPELKVDAFSMQEFQAHLLCLFDAVASYNQKLGAKNGMKRGKTTQAVKTYWGDTDNLKKQIETAKLGVNHAYAHLLIWCNKHDFDIEGSYTFERIFDMLKDRKRRDRYKKVTGKLTKLVSFAELEADFIAWRALKATRNKQSNLTPVT